MLETFEIVAKAVADPTRIRILKLLEAGELCVCQITTALDLATATISKHLSTLRHAGLLHQRRGGKWVYYRLAERDLNAHARPFLALLRDSLTDDPALERDRRMLARVQAVPLTALCSQGRKALPACDGKDIPSACYGA